MAKKQTTSNPLIAQIQKEFDSINSLLDKAIDQIKSLVGVGINPTNSKQLIKLSSELATLIPVVEPRKKRTTSAAATPKTPKDSKGGEPTPTEKAIMDALPKAGEKGIDLPELLKRNPDLKENTVKQMLGKMVAKKLITRPARGLYTVG